MTYHYLLVVCWSFVFKVDRDMTYPHVLVSHDLTCSILFWIFFEKNVSFGWFSLVDTSVDFIIVPLWSLTIWELFFTYLACWCCKFKTKCSHMTSKIFLSLKFFEHSWHSWWSSLTNVSFVELWFWISWVILVELWLLISWLWWNESKTMDMLVYQNEKNKEENMLLYLNENNMINCNFNHYF